MTVAEALTAVTTFYALTESKGTAQELFQFYTELDVAISACINHFR